MTVQDSEIERLYVEGQDNYANGDFAGAADAWTRLLDRMPEAQADRSTRENVLLNVLQAHLDGYARTRREDGSKDISHLRSGKAVLDSYFADFTKAYGDRAAVSAAVQEKADELEAVLAEAEAEARAAAGGDDDGGGDDSGAEDDGGDDSGAEDDGGGDDGPDIVVLESENDGTGMIVGGAVTAGLSLAGFGLLAAGGVIANRAEEDYTQATDETARSEAEDRGRTGNALTITGAIVGPVLLITGGVLIGLGIKKRMDAKATREEQLRKVSVVPTVGPRFNGLVLRGRF